MIAGYLSHKSKQNLRIEAFSFTELYFSDFNVIQNYRTQRRYLLYWLQF